MRKTVIVIFLILLIKGFVFSATSTPTALAYEVKMTIPVNISANKTTADLPKPVATRLPYGCAIFPGTNGNLNVTARVTGQQAKSIQTAVVTLTRVVQLVVVVPLPTATVTQTVGK